MPMTPEQRARMRDTITSAVARATLPSPPGPGDGGPLSAAPAVPGAGPDEVARFRRELEALAGVVHDAASIDDVAGIVSRIASAQGQSRIIAWEDEALGMPGLRARLEAAGLTLLDPQVDHRGTSRTGQLDALASAAVGLTGADAALSLTGSIVVTSGPGRPRLASLLTPVHVAIVRTSTIVDSLSTLIAMRPELVTAGSNFVCITGPSRTADIEHTLSRGVHGPGEIHAILIAG
jgi:L-lactate dehydrogenase complex protein LldG